MAKPARQSILDKLERAPVAVPIERTFFSLRPAEKPDREELISRFISNVEEQSAVVRRVNHTEDVKAVLAKITEERNIKSAIISTNDILSSLNLTDWEKIAGLEIQSAEKFREREAYREWVFNKAQAGITGVDYGIAESGTLCIVHNSKQPRLISLAPPVSIAMLPAERVVAVYEEVLDSLYADPAHSPAHISFITGPSMTADIQGGPFRGMHGPGSLYVIIIG